MVRFIYLKRYCWLLFVHSWWQKQDFIGKDSRLWHPTWQYFEFRVEGNRFREKCRRLHFSKEQWWCHFELWRAAVHTNAIKLERRYQEIQQTTQQFLQDIWDGQEEFGSKCDSAQRRSRDNISEFSTHHFAQHIIDNVVENSKVCFVNKEKLFIVNPSMVLDLFVL